MEFLAKYIGFLLMLLNFNCTVPVNSGISSFTTPNNITQITLNFDFDISKYNLKELNAENSIYSLRKIDLRYKSFLYFAFITTFLILIYIKLISPEFLEDLFNSFLKKNYLLGNYSKQGFSLRINNILLDVLFLAIISIYFYELLWPLYHFPYYLVISGLFAFITIQILIIFVFYNIFFGTEFQNIHLTNIFTFNRILGIVFTPLMFIITYLNPEWRSISLAVLLILLVAIIIFRIYRILIQLKNIFKYSFLYIIIYICVFEISLYIVLIKVFDELL
jgi:hypothetical protein